MASCGGQPIHHVDHQIDIRANGFANRFDSDNRLTHHPTKTHRFQTMALAEIGFTEVAKWIHPDRCVALFDTGAGVIGQFLWRISLEMHVEAHPIARGASEQAVDRQAGCFALDVPQGHIDGADGRHRIRAPSEQTAAEHVLPVQFDLQGVLAHEILGEIVDGSQCGEGLAAGRAAGGVQLADAHDPLIRVHLHVCVVAGPKRLNTGDFHDASLCCARGAEHSTLILSPQPLAPGGARGFVAPLTQMQ